MDFMIIIMRRTLNAFRYLLRGDFSGLFKRLTNIRKTQQLSYQSQKALNNEAFHIGILATPHTLFVAHGIASALAKIPFTVSIFTEPPPTFKLDFYFVVCPQMFKKLPPLDKVIAFQMEQSVSSRWFTKDYLTSLQNVFAVFDYSQTNLAYLETQDIIYPHTFWVPIGAISDYANRLTHDYGYNINSAIEKTYDVLFYGDVNVPRRKQYLAALGKNFNIRIEGNLFGAALQQAILSARVVVNIHYYEGALLETTRLYECISLGVPVVSEVSSDIAQHEELMQSEVITFTEVGDIAAMISAVTERIKEQNYSYQNALAELTDASERVFESLFYRALFALNFIDKDNFFRLTERHTIKSNSYTLSMPETTKRRTSYLKDTAYKLEKFDIFNGVRKQPGWIGCGLSYQYLAHKAVQQDYSQLTIAEDDVALGKEFSDRWSIVKRWLSENPAAWDIYSGLMAKIEPSTQVLAVTQYQGITFVTLDKMMSMVFNTYNHKALNAMKNWSSDNTDPVENTIDTYLSRVIDLKVVVALPFLVGHKEDLDSSLWGISNQSYSKLIADTEQLLYAMADTFKREHELT